MLIVFTLLLTLTCAASSKGEDWGHLVDPEALPQSVQVRSPHLSLSVIAEEHEMRPSFELSKDVKDRLRLSSMEDISAMEQFGESIFCVLESPTFASGALGLLAVGGVWGLLSVSMAPLAALKFAFGIVGMTVLPFVVFCYLISHRRIGGYED